jgi:hypothetical protein
VSRRDEQTAAVEEDFPGWSVWRADRRDDQPGEWVATLMDPQAGVSPTLMEPSAERLRAVLAEERETVRTRPKRQRPLEVF